MWPGVPQPAGGGFALPQAAEQRLQPCPERCRQQLPVELGGPLLRWVGQHPGQHPGRLRHLQLHRLPAGPISNPGLAAIRAALDPQCDPEVKDCYFFVTDQNGHYYYAKTYAEHQKNCAEADSVNKSLK